MYGAGAIFAPWFRGRFGPMAMGGRGRRGPGSWEFGGGPFGGFHFGRFRSPGGWRRPRVGRGDVRTAILVLLSEKPLNGYQVMQVAHAGTDAQIARAREILTETRRSLYRILADEEPEGDAQTKA